MLNNNIYKLSVSIVITLLLLIVFSTLMNKNKVDPNGQRYSWGDTTPRDKVKEDMVFIKGGEFLLGDDDPNPRADAPPRTVKVAEFYIDKYEVTNRQFARFVEETGYITTAERDGAGWIYKGGQKDWTYVKGASWKQPLGPGSTINNAKDHPVVLVSWYDAATYAKWVGKRLPTEAEWEIAARGNVIPVFQNRQQLNIAHAGIGHNIAKSNVKTTFVQHPSSEDNGLHVTGHSDGPAPTWANVWQGQWPQNNKMTDNFFYTASVGSFESNDYGIYDMIGNVWEWTADWYHQNTYKNTQNALNPTGPVAGNKKVARGGSWFCSANYCGAYRPGFRGKSPPGHAFNNVGFRCAKSVF